MAASNADSDDRLAQVTRALKAELPSEGPAGEVLSGIASALADKAVMRNDGRWRRRATVIATALAASLVAAAFWFDRGSPQLAFGDVLDRIREARQFSFQAESFRTSQPTSEVKSLLSISEPDKSRCVWITPQGEIVGIINGTQSLMIYERSRTVQVQEIPAGALKRTTQLLDELQEAVEKNAHSLGKKEIDGVTAEGFEAIINERKFVVWANVKSGDPVRIECAPQGEMAKWMPVQVLSHFKFDQQFPDEFFSLKVPEGYDVVPNESWQPIEELKRVLEAYAERHDGQFPAELPSAGANWLTELKIPENHDERSAEQRRLARSLDNLRMILKNYRANVDIRYLPGGTFGDAERPILWLAEPFVTATFTPLVPSTQKIRKPELPKADDPKRKFDVLYADLHLEKHVKRDLPPLPAGSERPADNEENEDTNKHE